MNFKRIIFWQVNPSPHQSAWIRELAEKMEPTGGRVVCVFQRELSPKRIAMGWGHPNYGPARILYAPDEAIISSLLTDNSKSTIHVFSSLVTDSRIHQAFKAAVKNNTFIGILSEGRDWRGWKGLLRQIDSARHERRWKSDVEFVLAIGSLGAKWYKMCGYSDKQIYPFCYVVEAANRFEERINPNDVVQIIALGQLVKGKRFDLLISSLGKIGPKAWDLKIIGDGELRRELEDQVAGLGLNTNISFTGTLDNFKVRQELEKADLLVLPSRWDGWGAVVNEALMSGVPVICSNYCGAADLISSESFGGVFECDSEASLASALSRQIERGPLSLAQRENIREWSDCVGEGKIAEYFLNIISCCVGESSRPTPPWGR